MARPTKDPVEYLRVKYMMHLIACKEHLPLSGYALERFFEPENIKPRKYTELTYDSGKWRRFLHQGVSPGTKSYSRIQEKAGYALKYLSSPIWDALETKHKDAAAFDALYRRLDKDTQNEVNNFIAIAHRVDVRADRKSFPLQRLIRKGDENAMAALFGLFRQFNHHVFVHDIVETALYNVIFNFICRFCPFTFYSELYQFIYQNFFYTVPKRFRASPWPESLEVIQYMIWIESKNMMLAEDLGLIDDSTSHEEFYFWKHRANKHLVIHEMASIYEEPNFSGLSPTSSKGLRWMMKKLNKGRPSEQQLSIEKIMSPYF